MVALPILLPLKTFLNVVHVVDGLHLVVPAEVSSEVSREVKLHAVRNVECSDVGKVEVGLHTQRP